MRLLLLKSCNNHDIRDIQNAFKLGNKLIFIFMFVQKTNSIGRGYISVKNRKKKTNPNSWHNNFCPYHARLSRKQNRWKCPTEKWNRQNQKTPPRIQQNPSYITVYLYHYIYQTGIESRGQLDCEVEGSGHSEKVGEQRLHEIQQRQSPALWVKHPQAGVYIGLWQDKKLFCWEKI